jgi:hypothetical protein
MSPQDEVVTRELLEAGKSQRGGWTRQQLAILGVAWPPRRGWPCEVIGVRRLTADQRERFLALRGQTLGKPADSEKRQRSKERRRRKGLNRRQQALLLEGDVRAGAAEASILLRVSVMTCGKHSETYHWQFDSSEGRRIMDYWPGNGTWRDPETGRKGKASDPWEALEVAKRLAAESSAAVLSFAPSQGSLFGS